MLMTINSIDRLEDRSCFHFGGGSQAQPYRFATLRPQEMSLHNINVRIALAERVRCLSLNPILI